MIEDSPLFRGNCKQQCYSPYEIVFHLTQHHLVVDSARPPSDHQ